MPDPGDLMLFALSSWRTMRWDVFKNMFDHFELQRARSGSLELDEPTVFARRRTALLFDALGHCDLDFTRGGGRLIVAPPVLASMPAGGLPRAVLCGSRGPNTLDELRAASARSGRAVRIEVLSQQSIHRYAPSRIELEADSDDVFQHFSDSLGISYAQVPPAWSITHFSGGLEEYVRSVHWSEEPELNWIRRDFDVDRLQFGRDGAERPWIRLSEYQDPVRSTWTYRLWRGRESAPVDVSWGRYAVLNAFGRTALSYDGQTCGVTVARTVPVPRLLNRALTLCSGLAPTTALLKSKVMSDRRDTQVDIYSGVPFDVYDVISEKLGQNGNSGSFLGDGNE